MPRERRFYRENLEQILKFTEGRQLLSVNDVRQFTGIKDYRTIKRRFPFTDNYISAATLAACMAGNDRE
jgi:hypothetical protein